MDTVAIGADIGNTDIVNSDDQDIRFAKLGLGNVCGNKNGP